MLMLKFDNIIPSIESSKNDYEEGIGIVTEEIKLLAQKCDFAFFVGKKSDNSKTLYFAYKPSRTIDHWVWCCPNVPHVEALTDELKKYWDQEKPTISLDYLSQRRLGESGLKDEITNILGYDDFKGRVLLDQNTVKLFVTEKNDKSQKVFFIAFKPSVRFGHWYLFSPTESQVRTLVSDLRTKYEQINLENDQTRWQ